MFLNSLSQPTERKNNLCEICRQNPCHIKCPNAKEKVAITCDECGAEIMYGDEYWTDISDNNYCSKECAVQANEIRQKIMEYE